MMIAFKKNILIRLTLSLCILLVTGACALFYISLRMVHERQATISHDIERIITRYADAEAKGLFSQLALLTTDATLASAWHANSFDRISTVATDRFQKVKATYNTTHLYLFTPDGTTYFRAHQPEHRLDKVTRASFINTQKSGKPSFGIELSSLGRLSLRAVSPWYSNGHLTGYIEVAKEIDQMITELGALESMGVAIHLKRSALNRSQIKQIIEARHLPYSVDSFPEYFLLTSTATELKRHAGTMLDLPMRQLTFLRKVFFLDPPTACGWNDIHDMSGQNVALAHVLFPIRHELTMVRIGIVGILLGGSFLTILIGLAFSRYLTRLQISLEKANSERDRYHELTDQYIPLASVSKSGVIKHSNFAFAQLFGITSESIEKGFIARVYCKR